MSKIDLNAKEFDGNVIFNDGVAGIVENVTIQVGKKELTDGENYPDYKLKFVAPNNASVDKGFYHLDENAENFEKRLKGLGSELKHIWGNLIGPEAVIPEFDTHKEMLNVMFSKFREAIAASPDDLYRVTVNYGNLMYPQQYLRVQMFPPYFERMTVEETRLSLRKDARLTPFVPDNKEATYDTVHTEKEADGSAWK